MNTVINNEPLLFPQWYSANEEELLIQFAESGADREIGFDLDRAFEDKYQEYLKNFELKCYVFEHNFSDQKLRNITVRKKRREVNRPKYHYFGGTVNGLFTEVHAYTLEEAFQWYNYPHQKKVNQLNPNK